MGDQGATKDFFDFIQPLRQKGQLKLVYASGRSLEKIRQLQNEEALIEPDAIIASVGTEIYAGNTLQTEWQHHFHAGWNRKQIAELCLDLAHMKPQPYSEQRPFKISFETDSPSELEVEKLRQGLKQAFPNVVVTSSHAGRYVDILPAGSDKGRALLYLADKWGVASGDIYTAGDSANDISMLNIARAIVVGNAFSEMRDWAKSRPENLVYFAKRPFAGGVVEGLRYYLKK